MQHVSKVLVFISIFFIQIIKHVAEAIYRLFLFIIVFRHHIKGKYVRQPIIINISHIISHGGFGLVTQVFCNLIFKGPILLVDIK